MGINKKKKQFLAYEFVFLFFSYVKKKKKHKIVIIEFKVKHIKFNQIFFIFI